MLLAGCGSGSNTAQVDGEVTLDGKPLPDIHVVFQPDNTDTETKGVGSYGLTDNEGKFTLKLSDSERNGALVGEHTVTLSDKRTEDPEDSDAGKTANVPRSRIPRKYREQPPTFEVKSGTVNQAKIELTSK